MPDFMPKGFTIYSTGWRDPRSSGLPLDLPAHLAPMWYKPFFINYSDGTSEISICEAMKYDSNVPDMDSLTVDSSLSVIDVALSGDRTAYYVPETHTLHFFSLDKNVKIRIRASLPVEELINIAESMV